MMDQSRPRGHRQQMKSCDYCRRKKVRCDTINRSNCSQCRKLGRECSFTTPWKRPARSRRTQLRGENNQPPLSVDNGTTPSHQSIAASGSPPSRNSGSRSCSGSLPNSAIVSLSWVRNSLNELFQRGMGAQDWEVFDTKDVMRLAYIGTKVSNLSHLIDLLPNTANVSIPLHLPCPHTHPIIPWKPELEQPLFGYHVDHDHTDHLQDLAAFPVKDVRDALVDAFFDKINPYFPVIDEFDFRRQYESIVGSSSTTNTNPPPLIQLQAVLLAGAHVCDHPRVSQSRAIVKATLFSRAKSLFNMRHENNRLHLIQAALLFTWHLENADTASANSYYWAGVACRIAFGIGMHRDLSTRAQACMMPIAERHIYRRVWWTLFQTEIFTALEHGRPSMISLDEIDQPPLEPADFIEENGLLNEKLNFDYCGGNIDLCYMILEILRLNSPGVVARQDDLGLDMARRSLHVRLINWVLKYPASDEFWSLQLQMHYQTVLLLLHREFIRTGPRDGLRPQHQVNSQSNDICNRAVDAIVAVFDTMLSRDLLIQCPFTAIIAATAAASHLSLEIRSATEAGATLLALNTQSHLRRLFRPIAKLSEHWPHAEAVLVLFQSMDEGFRSCIENGALGDVHPRYFPDQLV